MKVALVHYWLVSMRGGEKVLEALCELYPDADIYTHVLDPDAISPTLARHRIHTPFIQKLPKATKWYQKYLPLMPMALEQLDLRRYDLVISSESGPAKGIIVSPHACHICYCHSPMRYLWDMYPEYYASAGRLTRWMMPWLIHKLRIWDVTTAARVDHFIANSNYVAQRIERYYRRSATVINPPVETRSFASSPDPGDFYLVMGQLVPYKRVDVAVEAFNLLGKPLVVIGEGEQAQSLQALAKDNITFLGWQAFDVIKDYLSRCRALIFPGVEDFGIVPVEAMASGRPVIAFNQGGATETVIGGVSGMLFDEQTPQSLAAAVERFEREQDRFDSDDIVAHARTFDRDIFKQKIQSFTEAKIQPLSSSISRIER